MRLVAILLAIWTWVTPLAAEDGPAIEDVIGSQLEAFNARDVEAAWQYASPMIQRIFRTPGNFGMMVQRGYPMVWTNRDAEYLELRDLGAVKVQRVLIKDVEGVPYVLEYEMLKIGPDWRIGGVSILPAPEVGV